jgi:hypothetical protein
VGTDGIATRLTVSLTEEDWGRLRAKPRLVDYLIEKPPHGRRCARLILYQKVAKNVMDALKGTDDLLHRPSYYRGLADDQYGRESQTAGMILKADGGLRGMFVAQNIMDSETQVYCQLFARLVIGHENEPTCDTILDELRAEHFPVPDAGTCR